MNIHLEIDQVVVHGLDCAGLSRSAIESHLVRSLQTQLERAEINFEAMRPAAHLSLEGPRVVPGRHASSFEASHSIAGSLNSLICELAAANGHSSAAHQPA